MKLLLFVSCVSMLAILGGCKSPSQVDQSDVMTVANISHGQAISCLTNSESNSNAPVLKVTVMDIQNGNGFYVMSITNKKSQSESFQAAGQVDLTKPFVQLAILNKGGDFAVRKLGFGATQHNRGNLNLVNLMGQEVNYKDIELTCTVLDQK